MSRKDSAGTPATVVLTRAGVPFTTHAYDHDLKAIAHALGVKKAEMADPRAAERSSGYVVGGISPIGQKRPLRTVLDETAVLHDRVYVSGGRRGFDIGLSPTDLLTITQAVLADVAR